MTSAPVARAARTIRSVLAVARRPPYVAPGHFYSPLTSQADTDRAMSWAAQKLDVPTEDSQVALASQLSATMSASMPGPRYVAQNSMYGPADAGIYRAMLHHLRPARVIEVGSGYSTAVALDESDTNGIIPKLEITCIEPYPERLLGLLTQSDHARVTIIRKPVQDVALEIYDQLGLGDILFIDSTHVVKAGSDVVWLILHVLPRLAPGVVVHIHDVFWPFEYPARWLQEHRDWTEIYMLQAFLMGNADWEVMFFSSWLWRCHPELVPDFLAQEGPGSIWLRRIAEGADS